MPVDLDVARALLGVPATAGWEEIRRAYRTRIQTAHPDRAGGDTGVAAALNGAYAALLAARRGGGPASTPRATRPTPATTPPAPAPAGADRWEEPPEVLDGDTIHLALPPDEAFPVLLEAAHRVGDVTYVDRSCAIFEALVAVEGEGTCSLVVTLQGRADGTDAFCTLEAIERVAAPPVRAVTEALVAAI